MVDIFQLVGKFIVQNQEANDGIDETTNKAESAKGKISNAFGKIGSAAVAAGKVIATGLAAGSAAVGALAKASLESYASYEQLVGGVQTLFSETSLSLNDYAASVGKSAQDAYSEWADMTSGSRSLINNAQAAFRTAGMSANEYMETATSFSASLLQSLGGDTDKAAQYADMAIRDMSDNANKMGTSMEMIQNAYQGFAKQNYTMLDNLKLGYGGTKTEMERLLADANRINAEQGKITNYSIENLADVYDAIHVVQEEMGIYGATSNEAATTIEGSMKMVKASWENLLVAFAVGEDLLPDLIDNFVESIKIAASNIVPRLAQILGGISTALSEVIPIISAELPALLEQLLPGVISGAVSLINGLILSLPPILQILIDQFPSIMVQIGAALASCFPVLLETVQNLFGQIFDYVSLELLNTGVSFEDMTTKAEEVFNSLWEEVQEVWESIGQPIWDIIQNCIDTVRNVFSEKMPEIKDFVSNCFTDIGNFWENNLKPCFDAIGNFIETVLAPIFDFVFSVLIGGVVETVFNGIKALWEGTLKPVFTGITDFLTGIFTLDFEQALNGLIEIASGIFNGFMTVVSEPFDWAKNFIMEALEYIKGLFNFEWSLPELKLPHFRISGEFSLNPLSVPEFGIEWYAKGAVLNEPTAFGINPFTGNAMVGGEAGAEAVAPISVLQKYIKSAVQDENSAMVQSLDRIIDLISQFFPDALDAMRTPMVCDTNGLAVAMAPAMNAELGRIAIKKGRGR